MIEDFAQNIKQLESSFQTNKRKRKREDDDDFDYLYEIVITAQDGIILQGSKLPSSIEFSENALDKSSAEYQTLRSGVKKVFGTVVGLLRDRACVEEEPDRKGARIEGFV